MHKTNSGLMTNSLKKKKESSWSTKAAKLHNTSRKYKAFYEGYTTVYGPKKGEVSLVVF